MKTLSLIIFIFANITCKESTTVYICNSPNAKRYHTTPGCKGLSNCTYKIVKVDIEKAKKDGKTLCGWEKVGLLLWLLTLQSCFIQPGGNKGINYSHLVFTAKVIRIMDGDTMEVLYQNHPVKIRLAHIDCPEKRGHQPFGTKAKQALSDLCFGQMVTVQGQKYDRYKRLIAIVINDKKEVINQEMIKQGMAWHFKKYSSDPLYAQLEINARKNKIGLWQEADAVAPWAWREIKHSLAK